MVIRENIEKYEAALLNPHASFSARSRGRIRPETACPIRTVYQVDRDRILHSKAFRRLKHKTQVFLAPEGDHYRTRLTHTLEVAQIARTMARALRLNEDLTEAIALGHDLGHTPFGHAGERILAQLLPEGFHHVNQSVRVVEVLEKEGQGLNLTWEVRNGIRCHSKGRGALQGRSEEDLPATLEGRLVRLADVIAYVNHDLDDAMRAGLIRRTDVPEALRAQLGEGHSERINTMVSDIITVSHEAGVTDIGMSDAVGQQVVALRDWLFEHVYRTGPVEHEFDKASRVLSELYQHFMKKPRDLVACGGRSAPETPPEISVADFLAGMTDRYALNLYHRLFLPQPWKAL